ncbi:hypothetical protein M1446_05795 [Candidatus Dependentiae bacterium]|nr:hypothetical protein [Candidatus Dependentiae bacterium]
MKNNHVHYILIALIVVLSGCKKTHFLKQPRILKLKKQNDQEPKIVNIFLHGFKFISNYHFENFGLQHISFAKKECNFIKFAKQLNRADNKEFNYDDFYLFGWSGSLSSTQRYEASKHFYKQLKELIEVYKNTYGEKPFIRIMGHSHGGTVSLNLACLAKQNNDNDLVIDELVLLATPAQFSTAHYTGSKIFKQVYSIYSNDVVPILAPQGRNDLKFKCDIPRCTCNCPTPLFSRRKFPHSHNLIQAKVKFNGRGISHTGFLRCKLPSALPGILHDLKQECLLKQLPKKKGVYLLDIRSKIR